VSAIPQTILGIVARAYLYCNINNSVFGVLYRTCMSGRFVPLRRRSWQT